MQQRLLTPAEHRTRSAGHRKLGHMLLENGLEWGAVAVFYAAYHDIKAALQEDPIFDDHSACQAFHSNLLPDDRYASSHKARRGGAGGGALGVNDVVGIVYPGVVGTYDKLHQISMDVRYYTGPSRGALDNVPDLDSKFCDLVASGGLTSGIAPR